MKNAERKMNRPDLLYWRPCSIELPPLEIPVWLWLPQIEQSIIGCRTDDGEGWTWARCYDDWFWNKKANQWDTGTAEQDDLQPEYWMPLPQPPIFADSPTEN